MESDKPIAGSAAESKSNAAYEAAATAEADGAARGEGTPTTGRALALNAVQRQVIAHAEGPLLVLASPGSGKTTTMILRIGALIRERGIEPARIKAVTFSRAAAADMKRRYGELCPDLPPVDFSTIHSFAYEVVRNRLRYRGTPYTIIEGRMEGAGGAADASAERLHKKTILRQLYQQLRRETLTDEQYEALTTYISYVKNRMLPQAEWPEVPCEVRQAAPLLEAYEAFKRSGQPQRLLDYDDMLTLAQELLAEDEELLEAYQRKYDYILADESQDTSLVQHTLIAMLAARHRNLCVVADDDQSIYSWRGADPAYLLDFRRHYPEAKVLYMEQNYRSSPDIVSPANVFIRRNRNRYPKNMHTANPPGEPIVLRRFADYSDQTAYVVRELQRMERPERAAVLYRNNASSIALLNALDLAKIPLTMRDADHRFFRHWVVEDVLNFMRMTFTDRRPALLEKLYAKLGAYLSKQQVEAVLARDGEGSVFDRLLASGGLQDYQAERIAQIRDVLREMRGMPPEPAIAVIRQRLGYDKTLERISERLGFRKEQLLGILEILEEIARPLETMTDFALRLGHLEEVSRSSATAHGRRRRGVTLSTLHSAKGLEFERVYMIDLADGILPSAEDRKPQPGGPEPLEEAARLFYVGMTRAQRRLELLSYRMRGGERAAESPFVAAVRDILQPRGDEGSSGRQPAARTAKSGRRKRGRGKTEGRSGTGARRDEESGAAAPSVPQRPASGSTRLARPLPASSVQEQGRSPRSPHAYREPGQLVEGARVRHRVFGAGTIVRLTGERVRIAFGDGEKALSLAACLKGGLLEPG
ncbi:ATP-dependent helicase [Paenibacillus sp. IB182496]|uniref:DNA 3'-5' helicase n=1 Tax=Paenibacillus sabuli TaxID=2772509 RepID=A0A927BQY3_9BACL|nr:ATP-dependent helicase [Paenibacillus sabuli]MBD2843919.1 ATP-dependent helicase [Paenibacillus sabuli]